MKNSLVSVIMSVYNGQDFLPEAIESVLNQTFKNFEFVIVNDGSTDSSGEILRKYMERDKRIVLLEQNNRGQATSLNRGIEVSRGGYIARLDQGDLYLPEKLEFQVEYMERNKQVGLMAVNSYVIDENGKIIAKRCFPTSLNIQKYELRENIIWHGEVFFRRGCLDKVGLYREKIMYAEDYDLWLRISDHYKITKSNRYLYLYKWRLTPNGISLRNRYTQACSCQLCRRFAMERKKYGFDSYHSFDFSNFYSSKPQVNEKELKYFFHITKALFLAEDGECRKAREEITTSIGICPYKMKTYLYYLIFCVGKHVVKSAFKLRYLMLYLLRR